MTPEQATLKFNKLIATINFHVQNVALREQLVAFLNTDRIRARLLTAPASSQNHQAEPGGLILHTGEVVDYGLLEIEHWNTIRPIPDISQVREDVVVGGTLHDFNKVGDPLGRNFYVPNMIKASRKVGDESRVQSAKKPYEREKNAFLCGGAIKRDAVEPGNTPSSHDYLTAAVGEFVDRNKDEVREGELSLLLVNALDPKLYTLLSPRVRTMIKLHDGAYPGRTGLNGNESLPWFALHTADMLSSRLERWVRTTTDEAED